MLLNAQPKKKQQKKTEENVPKTVILHSLLLEGEPGTTDDQNKLTPSVSDPSIMIDNATSVPNPKPELPSVLTQTPSKIPMLHEHSAHIVEILKFTKPNYVKMNNPDARGP